LQFSHYLTWSVVPALVENNVIALEDVKEASKGLVKLLQAANPFIKVQAWQTVFSLCNNKVFLSSQHNKQRKVVRIPE